MTLDTSGPEWREPLACYDPEESSLRTWLVMSLWGWTPFSGTLPRWGMTRRGALYELRTPEHPTTAPDSSSLLPTPTTEPLTGNGHARHLGGEVKSLLPTPRTTDSHGPGEHGQGGPDLRTAIILLPTPTSAAGLGGNLTRSGDRSDEMLLPGLVKTFTGAPTRPPSPDGPLSPDALHPGQLSLDVPESD